MRRTFYVNGRRCRLTDEAAFIGRELIAIVEFLVYATVVTAITAAAIWGIRYAVYSYDEWCMWQLIKQCPPEVREYYELHPDEFDAFLGLD